MNMRLDKAGNGHSALRVEREDGLCGSIALADAHEATVSYSKIANAIAPPNSNVFDENIQGHRQGSLLGAPPMYPNASS